MKSLGNEAIDVYVTRTSRKGGRIIVDISAPPVKDYHKDIAYFGGGGTFVCNKAGAIVSRTYDR